MAVSVEVIQEVVRSVLSYQGHLDRYTREERQLQQQAPERLVEASVVCADGFTAPVVVDKSHWGNTEGQFSGKVLILHDLYHKATGYEDCMGLSYYFTR